jgi:uncharacterized protein YegL
MKEGMTELVFILDKSGSMSGLVDDTIGGYNAMLEKQRAVEGQCHITTVLFDNNYELLHDRINIKAVCPITHKEYFVGGSTALIDAIGRTIHKIVKVQRNTADDYRAEKVMFVIITDGEENSSREYSAERVKKMIEYERKKYGWEFIFLGANIDAVETAGRFGIAANRAVNYLADSEGVLHNYTSINSVAVSFRESGTVDEACLDEIRKDVKRRGGRRK